MAISETKLIQDVERGLRDRLPGTWKVDILYPPDRLSRASARLNVVSPNGTSSLVTMKYIAASTARYLHSVLDAMRRVRTETPLAAAYMAVAQYLSPRAREELQRTGYAYADATGNFYLTIENPPLFIEATGAERNPWPQPKSLQSLRGAAAGRSVRALCDFVAPFGIRGLATRAEVPAPTLSRVADYLERQGIVKRDRARGPILAVDWRAAIRVWAQDYTFMRSNDTSTWLEARGLPELEQKLRDFKSTRYAVTGSLAARALSPVTVPRLAAIYVDQPEEVSKKLGLRPAETGGNVVLARPYDPVVYERGTDQDGLRFAACTQVAADLITGPGRWPAEGEALLEWMADHEHYWRS